MSCGGDFIQGRVGQTVKFETEAVSATSISGRVVVGQRSTAQILEKRTVSQQALATGWTLDHDRIYQVMMLRIPRTVDVRVKVRLDGQAVDDDLCTGGSDLFGPWTVWGS